MFRVSSCPSSGAYQLQQQQQPLVYRRNMVVAVLLVVVGPDRNCQKLSESRGIKQIVTHAVSLRSVHNFGLPDNRCPLLFDGNLQPLSSDPSASIPKVISSHRRVIFS
jgi:hypothetical protein